MKNKIMLIILMLIALGAIACGTTGISQTQEDSKNTTAIQSDSGDALNYTNIRPEDAKKRLDGEDVITLLDVRTQEEYIEKHIPNSVLLPVEVIEKEAPSKLTDKDATIFVYCKTGRRSVVASETLVKMGYTKVYNLGGINDWTYETESGK
ncbi:MAG TPA: rhodanese-like domain-containing protein [Ruminiclostridium sp.]